MKTSQNYYVRQEGHERCADCFRRIISDLQIEAMSSKPAEVKDLLEQIKGLEEERKVSVRKAKAKAWFNRLEHGCIGCIYEEEYRTDQKSETRTALYWSKELAKPRNKQDNAVSKPKVVLVDRRPAWKAIKPMEVAREQTMLEIADDDKNSRGQSQL